MMHPYGKHTYLWCPQMKCSTLLLPLILLSTQTYAAPATTVWNNFHGNAAHTGYMDTKTDPAKLKVVWSKSFYTEQLVDGLEYSTPSITDHIFYVTMKSYSHLDNTGITGLYALNAATGETVWKNMFDRRDYFSSPPVFDNNKVFWLTGHVNNYHLTAVDAETGIMKLSDTLEVKDKLSTFASPVMFDHHLYIGDTKGFQYSVNSETGKVDWVVPAGDDKAIPTVSENYIFRNNYPGIDIINRQSGDKYFLRTTDTEKYTETTPIWNEKNKTVYTASRTFHNSISEISAIDTEQRMVKWKLTLNGYINQPVLAGDSLYVCDFRKLYEVNAITGKINWSTNVGESPSDMVATSDMVFISHMGFNDTVAISRETHKIVWTYDKSGLLSLDKKRLYVISANANFKGVDVSAIALN